MANRVTPNSEQIPLDVVGSSTFGMYNKISASKTYNMFISDEWLVPFPAYHKVLNLLTGGVQGRGIFKSFRGNLIIAVVDSIVYKIDANLSATQVGTIGSTTGPVFMDENLFQQICIVDGLNMYIYNYGIASGVVLQTGAPLGPTNLIPNYVTYHNTFFLIGNANQPTNAGNSSAWYAYQYASPTTIAEHSQMALQTKPDAALAIRRIPGQGANVLVLGGSVSEVHTNTPSISPTTGLQQDYQRNQSYSINYGCVSVNTIAESNTNIVWLGQSANNLPFIINFTGQEAVRISTDGIDLLLQSIQFPAQSLGLMYEVNGHLMYHLTFTNPADNLTLIYDFETKKFFHLSDHKLNFHPAAGMVYLNANDQFNTALDNIPQNLFFLSYNGGNLYQLSQLFTNIIDDINNDLLAGTDPNLQYEMQRIRICSPIRAATSAPFKINQLCFTIEMGAEDLGSIQECIEIIITEDNIRMFSESPDYRQLVPEGAGEEDCVATPYQGRVDLAISVSGGETFSNYVPRYLNTTAYYKNILRWNKMGRANDLTAKIRFWTLGRIVAANGYVEITP